MKLYYAETVNPRKACAVARHLGLPLDYVHVNLGKGEQSAPAFAAMNPNSKVPVLIADDGCTLWESNAIMCFLARQAGSELWPGDADRQIDVIRWLSWDLQHFTRHAGVLYFEHVIKPRFGMPAADRAVLDEALAQFRRFAAVLDSHLDGREWLVGDGMTVAEFAVAATLPHAAEAGLPLTEFPAIARWHDRLGALPAWREPFPAAPAAA